VIKIWKIWKKSKLNSEKIWKIQKKIVQAKDREPVDWRYHLGEDVYFIIKAPQLTIHIRKHFVPNGEWTLHPTKIGVTLSLHIFHLLGCEMRWKIWKKSKLNSEDRENMEVK
jgi:hypothetical protein